jgi:hypothetical protein
MVATRELLEMVIVEPSVDLIRVAAVIESLEETERTSSACTSAMVGEKDGEDFTAAIRADLDCVDICAATRRTLTRAGQPDRDLLRAVLEASVIACQRSNAQCLLHAPYHGHCRLCSESTSRCIDECRGLIRELAG